MKLILFGASGMVGQGVLREALADPAVEAVLSIGRRTCGVAHPKLLISVLVRVFPFLFTTSEILGRAMLRVAQGRADRFILESADINRLGA